jgi:hypothetical protein
MSSTEWRPREAGREESHSEAGERLTPETASRRAAIFNINPNLRNEHVLALNEAHAPQN